MNYFGLRVGGSSVDGEHNVFGCLFGWTAAGQTILWNKSNFEAPVIEEQESLNIECIVS